MTIAKITETLCTVVCTDISRIVLCYADMEGYSTARRNVMDELNKYHRRWIAPTVTMGWGSHAFVNPPGLPFVYWLSRIHSQLIDDLQYRDDYKYTYPNGLP